MVTTEKMRDYLKIATKAELDAYSCRLLVKNCKTE